jgi:hypothetical protein
LATIILDVVMIIYSYGVRKGIICIPKDLNYCRIYKENPYKIIVYIQYLWYSFIKEMNIVFKLVLEGNNLIYGSQDKVNMTYKKRPELTVFRHTIDDIKFELHKVHKQYPDAKVVYAGV